MQRLAQTHDRELRRAVDAEPTDTTEPRERRGVHDVALVLLEQERQERVHAVHDPEQVDAEHPLPQLERRVDDPAPADPRVVAHDVHRAERLQRAVPYRVDVGGDRHVGRHAEHGGPRRRERRDRLRQRRLLHVGQHEAHPCGGEAFGHRPPDPARPAGDHGHPVPELLHRQLLLGRASAPSLPHARPAPPDSGGDIPLWVALAHGASPDYRWPVMTSTVAVGPAAPDGAGDPGGATRSDRTGLSERVIWCFVAGGVLVSVLAVLLPTAAPARSCSTPARCSPPRPRSTASSATSPGAGASGSSSPLGLVLFAAGDVVFDVAQRAFGRADGYPFADILYLAAYPVLAVALVPAWRGARLDRETLLDSAIVAVALSAVIWQWVITPVIESTNGSTLERVVTVAYPLMDILLVVVIVHAVFTLPRWSAAAWLLFVGLALMLVGDALYARLVADGTYSDGGALDAVVADRVLPARGRGHAPVDARALGRGRRRDRPARTRPHGRARGRAVRGARGRAPRRLGVERLGRARGDHRHRRARRRLAHHPPGRRVEPGARRARRERGPLPRAGPARRPTSSPWSPRRAEVKYMSPSVDGIFRGPSDRRRGQQLRRLPRRRRDRAVDRALPRR